MASSIASQCKKNFDKLLDQEYDQQVLLATFLKKPFGIIE